MSTSQTAHATCVALDGDAVLIMGKSGSGKSALGLSLMSMGCQLVADDRVNLTAEGNDLIARCPSRIANMIEARGVGILRATGPAQAHVVLVVDLDVTETERLPARRFITLLGCERPLIYCTKGPLFAATILQILKAGWSTA